MVNKEKINIVTLGCYKNLVDSEVLLKQLKANSYQIIHNSDSFDYKTVIINTCGFINDAKQESIDTILQFVEAKKKGLIKNLFVIGCLSQRYMEELKREIPEVNQYFGVDCIQDVLIKLNSEYKAELLGERVLTTPCHYAYLKIAEGCNRKCSFCAIPLIRGKHISRPVDDIVKEAGFLAKRGVKELILISQDLSYYGNDLYKKQELSRLLNELVKVSGIEWIRLQYLFPNNFPKDIIPIIRDNNKVCKYIDIPFQHISDNILSKMRRGITRQETFNLIEYFKKEIPDVALRTTLIVGHPGETEHNFQELKAFVSDVEFDRLGVFTYSHEESTYAYKEYKDDVPQKLKVKRANEVMELQREISYKKNRLKIGKRVSVIVDRREGDFFIGRTQYDSPEIDGEVLINNENLKIGEFYNVLVYDADEYDLYGKINVND